MTTYEVRVRGVVNREVGERLATGAQVQHETVLRGPLDDQETLYDLIERLYALGLELVDVRQTSPAPEAEREVTFASGAVGAGTAEHVVAR